MTVNNEIYDGDFVKRGHDTGVYLGGYFMTTDGKFEPVELSELNKDFSEEEVEAMKIVMKFLIDRNV